MRQEMEQLRNENQMKDRILELLVQEGIADVVLQQLMRRIPLVKILEQIDKTTPSFAKSMSMYSERMSSDPSGSSIGGNISDETRITRLVPPYGAQISPILQSGMRDGETMQGYPNQPMDRSCFR
jgi:hypothetical protein